MLISYKNKDIFLYQLDIIKKKIKNRKILIWGAWSSGKKLMEQLIQNGFQVHGFIDNNKQGYYNNFPIYPKNIIYDSPNEYYVALSIVYHEDVIKFLKNAGLVEYDDYFYFLNKVVSLTYTLDYMDKWNNIIKAKVDNFYVNIFGKDTSLIIKNTVVIDEDIVFNIGEGSQVLIEENTQIIKGTTITVNAASNLYIGKGCKISGANIAVQENSKVSIGDNTVIDNSTNIISQKTGQIIIGKNNKFAKSGNIYSAGILSIGDRNEFGPNLEMRVLENTFAEIKDDCLFSYDITMRTSDGHAIYDLDQAKVISNNTDAGIIINSHVWVSMRCIILYNTVINTGCVLGAGSLVKKEYPKNCIIAGVPAKVIKTNIAWDRDKNLSYEEFLTKTDDKQRK